VFAPSAGYDRALTIFSPDGRLYQVEYAIETVRRGTLAIGIKCKEGVVLCAEERVRKLQNHELSQKLFQVDDHIGIAAAGYVPDARVMVDQARVQAQNNRLIYDEAIDVEAIARHLGDAAQQFTQYAGVRPFGVSLIVAGVDKNGPSIFVTDPSGTYLGYDAIAIGGGGDQVNELLEQKYLPEMSIEDACLLAVESIGKSGEDKTEPKHIKMAVVDSKTGMMKKLTEEEINSFVTKVSKPSEATK
jgi:proteasome alpha subunit